MKVKISKTWENIVKKISKGREKKGRGGGKKPKGGAKICREVNGGNRTGGDPRGSLLYLIFAYLRYSVLFSPFPSFSCLQLVPIFQDF